jgi:CheY-like chemotaxis protein
MLDDLGIHADVAEDGLEVVKMYKQKKYDFIFMDCQMPLLDGYDASRQIRALESGSDNRTPIVALTANALSGDRQKAMDAGMDDYLAKPFRQQQLVDIIYSWTLGLKDEVKASVESIAAEKQQANSSIDESVLRSYQGISGGKGKNLLDIIITGFLKNADNYLEELNQAADKDDCAELIMAAHKFKSAAGQAGAMKLMQMLAGLEKQANMTDSVYELQGRIRDVEVEYRFVANALPIFLKSI